MRAREQEPAEGPFNKLHLIVKGVSPIISHESFVTPNATTGGKVTLGDESRMWYGFAVRGTRTPRAYWYADKALRRHRGVRCA